MWPWVMVGLLCLLPPWLMFYFYRRALAAAKQPLAEKRAGEAEAVDGLLWQLEEAAELIISRLETKQQEVEAMVRLLDSKLETLELWLKTQEREDQRRRSAAAPSLSVATEDGPCDLLARDQLVKELLEAGLDTLAIAKRSGLRVDEVRLIQSLAACRQRTKP